MDLPTIIDPAYKVLVNELAADIDIRTISLASGGAHTFEDYREQVGYIRALLNVIGKCKELELARFGRRPGDKDD